MDKRYIEAMRAYLEWRKAMEAQYGRMIYAAPGGSNGY